jgi:WD40 repeat protein
VLVVGNSPRVELRSVETGKEVRPGHYQEVRFVAVSPDGRMTGTDSWDGTARLWETTTGRELALFECEQTTSLDSMPRQLGFSEDGKDVILTAMCTVRRLSAATGKEKDRATFIDGQSWGALAVSADGTHVLIGGMTSSPLIDLANGRRVRAFPIDDKGSSWGLPNSAAFSANGKTLAIAYKWGSAVGNHHKVRVWEVVTDGPLAEFDSGGPVALTPDGKILATVGDNQPSGPGHVPKVFLWDVATRNELHQLDTVAEAFGFEGLPLAFSPDGKLLATGGANGSVRLWDAATGKVVTDLKGSQGRVASLAFSANGKLLASGGKDTTVLLWKVP